MSPPTSWRDQYRQMGRDAAYLLLAWPLNLLAFLIVVPLVALGVGTVIIWVGLPVLVLSLAISAGFAAMGRRAAAAVDSSEPQFPEPGRVGGGVKHGMPDAVVPR